MAKWNLPKGTKQINFDFNHLMVDYVAESRALVRSDLRRLAHTLADKEQDKVYEAIMRLAEPPGRMLRRNFVERRDMSAIHKQLSDAARAVKAKKGDERAMMAWATLPYNQSEVVPQIKIEAQRIREQFGIFVVLGIGGSALGPIMVQNAMHDLRYNELPREVRGGPKIYIEDNIDPERMASLLNIIEISGEKACFNVISKSGDTSETMAQFMTVADYLKRRYGKAYADHIVVTTSATRGNLVEIADQEGLRRFAVPEGVGGRFSEMSPVGLLAAAVAGVNIDEMLKGAADMDARCQEDDYLQNPALLAAGALKVLMDKGLNIQVIMPYADSLRYMADWYAQLWAESIGKNVHRDGTPCMVGQTPVKALGVTDQHSQVQLYTEGPEDKVITFLRVEKYRSQVTVPVCYRDEVPDVEFLSGHTFNELMDIEMRATEYALLKAAKPSFTINFPEVNAYTLGQAMYFFEMQTAYMGELLDIDAFNQPGVEEGKNAAYAMLEREGYVNKRAEIDARLDPKDEYVL